MLNNTANVAVDSKVTKQIENGKKFGMLLLLPELNKLRLLVIAILAAIIVAAERNSAGEFTISDYKNVRKCWSNTSVKAEGDKIHSKTKINGFNTAILFQNQDAVNLYWRKVLIGLVISWECHG